MFAPLSESTLTDLRLLDTQLKGVDRRLFRAVTVKSHGRGAANFFRKALGWIPATIRKGLKELEAGAPVKDNFQARGRKPMMAQLPNLERDIRKIADPVTQTDPTFRTTQLYRKLTAKETRRQLIENFGYTEETAPAERSLRRMLTALGYKPQKVRKSLPLRKIKETNGIFKMVRRINAQADADEGTVRISIDTKTTVPIGNLSRGGKSRREEKTLDHDMEPQAKLTPFGIFNPVTSETQLVFTTGSVTADFMADRLEEIWPTLKKTIALHIPW